MKDKGLSEYQDHVLSIRSLTVSWKKRMRLSLSHPQDPPISNQQICRLHEEKYGCQKIVKLNGLLAQGMSHIAWLPMQPGPVTHVQDIKSSFEMLIPDTIQKIILDCTNLEGRRAFGERPTEPTSPIPEVSLSDVVACVCA